jgi:transposase-like protein
MNNGTSRHQQFSPAEISKVLARYRQSGLGVVEFAHEQGIPPGRLHYWIYQKGRTRRSEAQRVSFSKPVFQELKVASMLPPIDSWIAEVNLPGGLAVRFSQKAAAEWIGSVVQALRRPC